jgi:Cadherin-like
LRSSATTLSSNLSVSDPRSTTLASATVSITGGSFVGDGDMLSVNTTGTSITASYNSSTETLTLSGVDTLADYQAVLRTVSFTTASRNPTNSGFNSSRTMTWVVSDGFTFSTTATTTLIIATPPTLVSDNPLAVEIGTTATITSSLLAANDSDNSNGQLTYTVVTGPSFGTLLRNGSAISSFTQADIENGLIAYRENGSRVSSDSFTFYVSDPSGSRTANTAFQFQVFSPPTGPNPSPPAGTSAEMVLRHGSDGLYEIYDLGNNAILAGYSLGQVGAEWQFAGLDNFNNNTTGMLLRNSSTGEFEVYDISNNNISSAASLGMVGSDWQVAGFGNFSSRGTSDMILRNSNTGAFEVYDIANNQISGAASLGMVGSDWQVAGFGDFSSRPGETDMIMRNTTTGGLEVYDISNNQITSAAFLGASLDWKVAGVGNFSSIAGETNILLRNSSTGAFEVYDIANNQITGAAFLGTVGLEWQVAGFGPVNGASTSDMVLRNVNTGAFEVYDIANNQITSAAALGSVGLDWQVGGFAPAQLVQAMAGFGGGSGAAESSNTVVLGADTSQQSVLTTPQHA